MLVICTFIVHILPSVSLCQNCRYILDFTWADACRFWCTACLLFFPFYLWQEIQTLKVTRCLRNPTPQGDRNINPEVNNRGLTLRSDRTSFDPNETAEMHFWTQVLNCHPFNLRSYQSFLTLLFFRIQVNDQILKVDGVSLVGVTQAFAAQTLKNTSGVVRWWPLH